jgi:hypothetical protein
VIADIAVIGIQPQRTQRSTEHFWRNIRVHKTWERSPTSRVIADIAVIGIQPQRKQRSTEQRVAVRG